MNENQKCGLIAGADAVQPDPRKRETATHRLQMRVKPTSHAKWKLKSSFQGVSVSSWLTALADKACE